MARVPAYWIDDTAQQVVGAILLAGPFVVTEEVWRLAQNMTMLHSIVGIVIVLAIGYGALYHAPNRDPDKEYRYFGIPLRYLSLVASAYGAVFLLVFLFTAPETFQATTATTVKMISIGAIFSVVGAATADSLF